MDLENLRSNKYTAENLDLLLDGFTRLLHQLSRFNKNNPTAPASDVVRKLTVQDKEVWEKLKEVFDEDSLFTVYDQEANDPTKILAAIFNSMDECREELLTQAKVWEGKENKYLAQIEDLSDQLQTNTHALHNLEHKQRGLEAEIESYNETIAILEKQSKSKDEKIDRLSRGDNVTLWQKEKDRAFEDHIANEKRLKDTISSMKTEFALKVDRYERQITELHESGERAKLTSELKTGQHSKQEMNELKLQVFYLAKDLLSAEREISRLQKEMTGVLNGVERDFRIVHQNMVDNNKFNIKHMDKLAGWLAKLSKAFQAGDMAAVQKEMPDYYICPPSVAKNLVPIKVRTKSTPKKNANKKQEINLENLVRKMEKEVMDIETEQLMIAGNVKAMNNGKASEPHPEMVYNTGNVNTTALIKHFPELSVGFVKEQWANFKRYDKNGDGTLDLSEMMVAITSTFGHKFTAQEVVDVMNEVDDDQSSTLDFYEYLKVSVIILKKSGQATLFKDEDVLKNKKEISKTCVIQ